MLLRIGDVPWNAASVDKIANAEAGFYGFKNVPRNAKSVCLILN